MANPLNMNVAEIRDIESAEQVHILFYDSPQIYFLDRDHRCFDDIIRRLQNGLEDNVPVNVQTTEEYGTTIENVG